MKLEEKYSVFTVTYRSSYLPFITACGVFFPHVDVARLTLNSWQWTFWLFFYCFLLFLRGSTLKQLDWC